jgi:pimeloyl-ACP methyl ester carboxylesterase
MTASVAARRWARARNDAIVESMRRVHVDGVDARYLIAGSGPPLLLVASPLVLAHAYRPIVRRLATSFTVVVVELPGAGASDRIERAWSSERYGAWLVDLVRRLPLAAPLLIGHSDSAPEVVEAARIAPKEIRGIVLVGPCGAGEPRSVARMIGARALDAFGEPMFSLRVTPHLVRNAVRHGRVFLDHIRAAAAADSLRAAGDLCVPTLLAWGDRDRTVPLEHAARLGRVIEGAKLVVGSGSHDWLVTHADAFAGAVRRFSADIASIRRA